MTTTSLLTAEDLYRLPNDRCHRYELVRGELVTAMPPGFDHGSDALRCGELLNAFVRPRRLGRVVAETGFVLFRGPDTVRAPDVAYVVTDRLPPPAQSAKFFEGAPDLAVEVISPSDTTSEVIEKVREYLTSGTRLVWLVDRGTRSITVYRANGSAHLLQEDDELSGEDVLPGFSVRVREVFA